MTLDDLFDRYPEAATLTFVESQLIFDELFAFVRTGKKTAACGAMRNCLESDNPMPDGKVEIGIWECTPGRFRANRAASSEFCHFIAGVIEMTHADGTVVRLGPGDAINLPLGWTGEWRIIAHTRKLYVSVAA